MKAVLATITWACCLTALLAGPVSAQDDVDEAKRDVELAEDMEIMGRLLEETLETAYRHPKIHAIPVTLSDQGSIIDSRLKLWTVENDGGSSDVVRAPLSSYLEGYGIVVQTEAPLPRPQTEGQSTSQKTNGCPFLERSPWERMQMRLRSGDAALEFCKSCHDPKSRWDVEVRQSKSDHPQRPTREALVEALVQVLAENGHNMRKLRPDEQVTVAVTFQPESDANLRAELGNARSQAMRRMYWGTAIQNQPGVGQRKQLNLIDMFGQPQPQRLTEEELSVVFLGGEGVQGELLLKSQQFEKAIDSFEKALREAGVKDPYEHTPRANQRAIYQKLIQAHVGAGNLEEAQKLIAALRESEEQDVPAEKDAPPPLPSRLVVSATKAQLDQVVAGEMSREEFAEQVQVQFYEGRSETSDERAEIEWKDLIDPERGGILYDARDLPAPPAGH